MVVPPPTIVIVLPETVATLGLLLAKLTGKEEDAVAVTVKGVSPRVLLGSEPKVIV